MGPPTRHDRQNAYLAPGARETLATHEWSKRTGIPANVISNRLNRGWTPERAVNTPVRPRRRRDA